MPIRVEHRASLTTGSPRWGKGWGFWRASLGPTLWRRFDAALNFGPTNPVGILAAVERFMDRDLESFGPWVGMLASALHGKSLSEVERTVLSLRRSSVLNVTALGKPVIDLAMQGESNQDKHTRRELAIAMAKEGTAV